MATAVKMPQMGESVVDGTVSRWLKREGEQVEKLEPLLEISTDKIDTEVTAPAAGVLLTILVDEGKTVDAGTVIGYIGEPGEEVTDEIAPDPATTLPPDSPSGRPPSADPVSADTVHEKPVGRAFISPVVARIAGEHDVDLEQVPGTGLHGRITKKDVLAYIEERPEAAPAVAVKQSTTPRPQADFRAEPGDLGADEILQPLSTMRRAIAEHMSRSVQTSPHVATVFEADMTAVVRHREANKARFADKGINLTFTPYFVAAVAAALRAFPKVNSRYSDAGLMLNQRIHVGVAVAVENGLLVPVIRDADERNLQGLARAVNGVSEAARGGQLSPDDLQGGTFTVTNHGVGGSLLGTPIIHQPQAGILGIGAIVKRPIVHSADSSLLPSADDAIVIRPMCYLSFSFDHRILDGALADAFVRKVKERLETWTPDVN